MSTPVCVITGVGPGNGASFTRRFAGAGYRVAMLARDAERLHKLEAEIPNTRGFPTDVSDAAAVRETFGRIRAELGGVNVLIHNAGSGTFGPFMNATPEEMELSWRTNTLALLLCGQEAASDMLAQGAGSMSSSGRRRRCAAAPPSPPSPPPRQRSARWRNP